MPQVRAGLAPIQRRHRPWPGIGGELPLPLWEDDYPGVDATDEHLETNDASERDTEQPELPF
jgi:hypothetical protein